MRTPIADAYRGIDNDRTRCKAIRQGGGIDVRLERGPGLAQRVDRAVKLTLAVVAAADHGAHRPMEIRNNQRGLICMVVVAVVALVRFDLMLGVVLQIHVDGGADSEVASGNRLRESIDELAYFVERLIEVIIRRVLFEAGDRGGGVAAIPNLPAPSRSQEVRPSTLVF